MTADLVLLSVACTFLAAGLSVMTIEILSKLFDKFAEATR